MSNATAGLSFTVTREQLRTGLAAVTPALSSAKATLPVLEQVLVEASEGAIHLAATDLNIAIRMRLAASVGRTGRCTLPAKRLAAIVRELPPQPCDISNGGLVAKLKCGETNYRLTTLAADEFPNFPTVDFTASLRVLASDLKALIVRTTAAASREMSRPILQGVLLQLSEDREMLRAVATNGARLALVERRIRTQPPDIKFTDSIVHASVLDQVANLFADDDDLEIARNANIIAIRSPNASIQSRLIDGPFPEYKMVIPKSETLTFEAQIDRLALIAALKRMVAMAPDNQYRVTMVLSKGKLAFSVQTTDAGDGQDVIAAEYEGELLRFAMNAKLLVGPLETIDSDSVRLLAIAPERAFVLKPLVKDTKGRRDRELHVAMPLRLMD